MEQQTAVDWLIEQLQAPCRGIPSHITKQAKQIEKVNMLELIQYVRLTDKMGKSIEDLYNGFNHQNK